MCDALSALFDSIENISLLAITTTLESALAATHELRPEVVLIDAVLSDRDQFRCARSLTEPPCESKVLFLDDQLQPSRIAEALRIGIIGYFSLSSSFQEIADGVIGLAQGEYAFGKDVRSRLVSTPTGFKVRMVHNGPPISQLTRREIEVMATIARGYSVKQCAKHLRLAESTVDNHKSRLMKKLHVHKAAELTRLAIREGLVSV